MAFLELKNVAKGYGTGAKRSEVLHGINLELERGEFVAIVGYSGSGKTTLISLIAGLLAPDSGSMTLNDLEITSPGPDRGIVFQNYSLLPWMSVYENIYLAVDQVFPNWAPAKKKLHTEKYIEMVNLTPARDKKPAQLSGGMRQRVSVARALAMDPQILLMDEPFSALDALTRGTLQEEVARIWEESKKTVVMITNDVDEAIFLADRIVPLTPGPNATFGPEITVNLPRPRDRRQLNHEPKFKEIRAAVTEFLLSCSNRKKTVLAKKLRLPDIEPEDLSVPRNIFSSRREPIRRRELKEEAVEVGRE